MFGLLIDFDLVKAVTSTDTKPEVVFSRRGRHLEKWIWRHISAVGASIWTKFGSLMQNNVQISRKWSKLKPKVDVQYGGRLFFKTGSSYFSAINWDMSTKFGLLIDFDLLKAAISTNTKPEIVLLRFGRHIALSRWRPRPLNTIYCARPYDQGRRQLFVSGGAEQVDPDQRILSFSKPTNNTPTYILQEAQLSQRGRTTLRVHGVVWFFGWGRGYMASA